MTKIEDLKELNNYIKRKYNYTSDILYSDGNNFLIIDFHSCSGDISTFESISIDQIQSTDNLKEWIRTILK